MPLLSSDSSASELLLVAAASAAASSLLTYAVFRWQGSMGSCKQAMQQQQVAAAQDDGVASNGEVVPTPRADPYDTNPRLGHLVWDDYFMAVAFLSAQRSKDPNKQVGACIVDRNNIICGIGYNGFPRGCPDSELPWAKTSRQGDPLGTKYPYVCHAEMNAVLNKNGASVVGAKVFVTMFPCNECAKLMIQAGISEIVYHEDKDQPPCSDSPLITSSFNQDQQYAASRRLLALAGVKLRQHLFQRPILLRLTNTSSQPAAVPLPNVSGTGGNSASSSAAAEAEAALSEAAAPAVEAALRHGGDASFGPRAVRLQQAQQLLQPTGGGGGGGH